MEPAYGKAVVGGGEYLVAFSDRPEVREVVRWLLSSEYGQVNAQLNPGFLSPNQGFPATVYSTRASAALAGLVAEALAADLYRFDGSDLMPIPVMTAFWEAMVDYVGAGPQNRDELLAAIDAVWAELDDAAEG